MTPALIVNTAGVGGMARCMSKITQKKGGCLPQKGLESRVSSPASLLSAPHHPTLRHSTLYYKSQERKIEKKKNPEAGRANEGLLGIIWFNPPQTTLLLPILSIRTGEETQVLGEDPSRLQPQDIIYPHHHHTLGNSFSF